MYSWVRVCLDRWGVFMGGVCLDRWGVFMGGVCLGGQRCLDGWDVP